MKIFRIAKLLRKMLSQGGNVRKSFNILLHSATFVCLTLFCLFCYCGKNEDPEAPWIDGPTEGWRGEQDTFFVSGTDSDGDSLSYFIDWGDGNFTRWSTYYTCGDTIQFFHKFATESIYSIRALSEDISGDTSVWSEPHDIAIFSEIYKKWEFNYAPGGDPIPWSPALADNGTIYVCFNEVLFALDADAVTLWSYNFSDNISSSPAIADDGTIYVSVSSGEFVALNPNGSIKWTYPTGRYPTGCAIGGDGTIYVASTDSSLYALNPDGSLKWVYQSGGAVYYPPVIGQSGIIYVGPNDGYYYAITSAGTLSWKLQLLSSSPHSGATAALAADETILISERSGNLYAVTSGGQIKWYLTLGSLLHEPVIGPNGTIYTGSDSMFYAISPNGTILWNYNKPGEIPAITADDAIVVPMYGEIYKIKTNGTPKAKTRELLVAAYAPVIADNGIIFTVGHTVTHGFVFALEGSSRLNNCSWPMYQHDVHHTGRAFP